jgi:glycosyltransferase involved in cell wall biosynthesis
VRCPVFSVIIPTFNRAGLVREAVLSVLEQKFGDYEIVVVDDGSTDGTREALRPYTGRIRYFHQENAGVAAARNRGIAESRGEYLAFLDSDDLFAPRMLEQAHRTFERYPEAGAVLTAEIELDSHGRTRRVITKNTRGKFFTPAGMIGRDTNVGSGRPGIVRRRWVEKLGGYDESLRCAVDCDLWIRYSFHMSMVLQPEPLVLRRWHPDSLVSNRLQDASDWIRILEKVARDHPEFVRGHPRVYRRALAKNHLRYGRELLAVVDPEPGSRRLARQALSRAIRIRPVRVRAYAYLGCSYLVPPSAFRRWRAWERRYLDVDGRMAFSGNKRVRLS